MDRVEAMRVFVAVVDEGAFAHGADRLEMSPQLVSKYVSRLEQHLGVRLLNRTTRRIHLTEEGGRYYQRARHVLEEIEDMENELGNLQSEARGLLRISAPVSFAIRHLAPVLADFQNSHPAVGIDLQLNDRKVDIVEEGFDVALRIGHLRDSSLVAKRIAPIRLVYCAAPDYLQRHGTPLTLADLAGHRFLRYSYMEVSEVAPPSPLSDAHAPGSQSGLVSNNGDVLVEAALRGAGIVLQPTFIVGEAVRGGRLKTILTEQMPAPMGLYAVYAHRQLLASKVRRFVDFIGDYFGDAPWWDAAD